MVQINGDLSPGSIKELLGGEKFEGIHFDEHKRLHYTQPRKGPLHVFNRANLFHTADIQTHVNDIIQIYKGQTFPAALLLRTDRGPDWNLTYLINLVFICRLWFDKKMDLLIMVAFAPYNSAFGIIEHDWAILSNTLSGVVFDTCLPGETLPPLKQRNLSEEERVSKEATLFDSTLQQLSRYYKVATTSGFPVNVHTVKCQVVVLPKSLILSHLKGHTTGIQ